MQPDYAGGGLVNLMASIVEACGGRALHPTLEDFALGEPRNIVLLVVDGLGDNYLMRRGGDIAASRRRAITSVFPSTTASAITTTYTGCTPLEHGLTGWFTYFSEAACVAASLPFRSRGDMLPLRLRGVRPEQIYIRISVFEQLPLRSLVVTARDIVDSEYNLRHCAGAERLAYETLDELVAHVERAVKSGAERKFVYAYWPAYDQVSHRFGCESAQAAAEHEKVDAAFAELRRRLRGTETTLLVTADHGFVDSPERRSVRLDDHPELAALLARPLCGEQRTPWCYLRPGAAADFERYVATRLAEAATAVPVRQLLDEGWFGPGPSHPRLASRIGDFALIMRDNWTIKDWLPGERRHTLIGVHGGVSADEMEVPLVALTL